MQIKKGREKKLEEYKAVNSDGYGRAIIAYAVRWADKMESLFPEKSVKDVIDQDAERLNYEADEEGITGHMHACAVRMLVDVWEYGELLRVWHNKQCGYEGDGVVNPAIITVDLNAKDGDSL